MGIKYAFGHVNSGYDSGYDSEGGSHYIPERELGKGAYSLARQFRAKNGKTKAVLKPVNNKNIDFDEVNTKYRFYQTIYPDSGTVLIKNKKTYRLVVPCVPGVAYKELKLSNRAEQIALFTSVVKVLTDCHNANLAVIDLKEDNIYFDVTTGKSYLIDGGLSTQLNDKTINADIFQCQSQAEITKKRKKYKHIAPECWSTSKVFATRAMDIYSLGFMMKTLLINPDTDLVNLMNRCLRKRPNKRISLEGLQCRLSALSLIKKDLAIEENKTENRLSTVSVNRNEFFSDDIDNNAQELRRSSHVVMRRNVMSHFQSINLQKQKVFQEQMILIKKQAQRLYHQGYIADAKSARQLFDRLSSQSEQYFQKEITGQVFKDICTEEINAVRNDLSKHRLWRLWLVNVCLAIAGLGIGYVIVGGMHKCITGHFLFFDTNHINELELDTLNNSVEKMVVRNH